MPPTSFLVSPLWDEDTQSLYMTDFVSPPGVNSIYRYDYAARTINAASIVGEVNPAYIIPVVGNATLFVVGFEGIVKLINWDRVSPTATVVRPLFTVYGHLEYAATDSKGRLYTGTLNGNLFCAVPADYAAYRYANGKLTTLFKNIRSTNAIQIDERYGKLYHADGCQHKIVGFDYDVETGDICKEYYGYKSCKWQIIVCRPNFNFQFPFVISKCISISLKVMAE